MATRYEVRDYLDAAVYPDGRLISRHRTESAARASIAEALRAVRERNGPEAYLDYRIVETEREPGRPPVEIPATASLTIRIPEALRARLDARAEADGSTVGAVVREAIERHLG